ncbi:MAG: RES family NAD+ phosphorylase, partial [Anaerolineales bacterium]
VAEEPACHVCGPVEGQQVGTALVRVWRICRRRYAAFDGEGARLYQRRWNQRGTRIVYTSESLSLAALEYFVNLDTDLTPDDLVSIAAEVPDQLPVHRVAVADLPDDWQSFPAPAALQELGTTWASQAATAVLAIPSAVIPQEWNYLLNPAHPDFRRIRIHKPQAFFLDPRLWKRK